ncbi:MAG: F0F1 ATP synthase subunit epsilon [Caldisericia bacterium]|nr:F0F1 ATP synthase subunit epsilon [Caldisericia bacterium]
MKFRMILPEGTIYTNETDSIIVPLMDGLAGIKKGHSPMLAELADGIVTLRTSEEPSSLVQYRVQNAMIEVLDNQITVLTDHVEVLPKDTNKTTII